MIAGSLLDKNAASIGCIFRSESTREETSTFAEIGAN